ncbi:hypothetical protein TruAng_002326 [Truncatella angustata]|nr:hypothetical protein TruAng_002326 [Truncatella angustata]
MRPDLQVAGNSALFWAEAYLVADGRTETTIQQANERCGVSAQLLCHQAILIAVTKDKHHTDDFVQMLSRIPDAAYKEEWLWGMAGTLYFVRLVRRWMPSCASALEAPTNLIQEAILANGTEWVCNGTRWLGAAHGDIGIVTQLVLTTPSVAPRLSPKLEQLLDLQMPNGNWPVTAIPPKSPPKPYVQFCHGAPGFVLSLRSLRPYFPQLRDKIDTAIRLGSELIWKEGILKKEPSLCHGTFGNALCLQPDQREHLLTHATPEYIAKARAADSTMFEKSDYGFHFALFTGYWPGAAWAWLVCESEEASLIGYNDV